MKIKRNILLNPGPATTADSVKLAQVVPDICPREKEFGAMVDWIQEQLVGLAGSTEHNVCVLMGGSGTAAVESVISSVIPEHGGLLVIHNGAYGARILKIAKIYKIPVAEFSSPDNEVIDYRALEACIENTRAQFSKDGKELTHLAAVHHETTTGLLNDVSSLGAVASTHTLSLILDAMSSYGAIPIDMDRDNVHFLVSSSNKNIQGMAGVGVILCNTRALLDTRTIPMRTLYLNLYDQYQYFLKTQQFRFTPPVQTLYALRQALQETIEEGVAQRHERYLKSYACLRQGMEHMGFKVLVPHAISSGLITTFYEPQSEHYDFDDMHDYLLARGYTIYPGKVHHGHTFRVANIGQIDFRDIENFLKCVQSYITERNIVL